MTYVLTMINVKTGGWDVHELDVVGGRRFELRIQSNCSEQFRAIFQKNLDANTTQARQDWNKALELWTRAVELGSCSAHYHIGRAYFGTGIEKDVKKAIHHLEIAAMAEHESARYNLGVMDANSGNLERAIKHWIISASAGHSKSILMIKKSLERGHVQNDVCELTMKAYNHSCEEMRSEARGEDAAYF
jgi:TPR repeat protein